MDLITPSILCQLLRRAYRLHRLQFRSFKYLYRTHSLEYLISIITPHYLSFSQNLKLWLSEYGVEIDFDAVRWSNQSLDLTVQESFKTWLQQTKSENSNVIDMLIFRIQKERYTHESSREGLVFAGLRDGNLSSENIRDIGLYLSTINHHQQEEVDTNGDTTAKRSVSLPGISQSWDSVVQTSSSLLSALSFRTAPAKRSPLSIPMETPQETVKENGKDEGKWIIGGDKEGKRIWFEASGERLVPISLGNLRPGFLREGYDQQSPDEDALVEIELSVYEVCYPISLFDNSSMIFS